MDIESDDSERWEDFFGSSTELAPSLLGIYDNLTSSLDVSNSSSNSSSNSNHTSSHEQLNGSIISSSSYKSASSINSKSSANSSLSKACSDYSLHNKRRTYEEHALQTNNDNDAGADADDNDAAIAAESSLCCPLRSDSASDTCDRASSSTLTSSGNTSTLSLPLASCYSNTASSHKTREFITPPGSFKHRNNIRILSPNVQRIITHSDAEPVHTVDIEALQTQHTQKSPVLSQRYIKKAASPVNGHKVKLSHIPLSKITGKLTQAGGSDLVETFDSSSEYLDALNFLQSDKKTNSRNIQKPPTPAIITIPNGASAGDDEKTPTNAASPFNFDCMLSNKPRKLTLPKSESQESIKLIEMEKLAATTAQLLSAAHTNSNTNSNTNINSSSTNGTTTPKKETLAPNSLALVLSSNAKEFIAAEPPLSPTELVEAINYNLVTPPLIEQLTLNTPTTGNNKTKTIELIEAINKPLISKTQLMRSSSAACASTVAGSPLLTYARAKSLAAKANTLGGAVPIKLPTAQQLEELEEASKMSAESLDRLTDIKSKFSPKESRKISGLMLPEIAKLKHRPLSSSSICSTSSSSSSGSDHLNGKLTTSYLASVESLADQSENELMDPHSGMSVFERACLEIVDSERSFVEDLRQVIKGYLLDWKERACLRYDELRILFSNIEEIYDFNSTLLNQLINSGMDPVKIAKCFIDLRECFDVYTTYCTSYPEAISLLTKLLQATHTNALLTSTQKMLQHTLPLGSYLLKPVQRILKYHLLLDNLRKHCDVKEVFQAYEIMRQVARNIDQVKRKLEQQSRVKELSGILDGWLGPELTVLGELRQEGLLMEHNKPRMVFLFTTMLIITKPKEDNRLQFKSYIHQNNLMLSEHLPGEPTSFYVIPYDEPRNQIKLTAKNRDQKRLWAQHIKGVILEKFDNIPNRAKELVYKLGDEEDRTPDKNTWKWSLHSTSTPIYLERRNQYRRSEIRNRSKFKRKTVSNSSSFDSFNEIVESSKEATQKPNTALSRNNSMDDNMLPALQKLAAAVKLKSQEDNKPAIVVTEAKALDTTTNGNSSSNNNDKEKCVCAANADCTCILRNNHQRQTVRISPKSPIFSGKALKERSKSVPRISFQTEDLNEERAHSLHVTNTNLDARKSKSSKSIEIKQYNHKTIPKRIANLKKQRSSKKETSKFYMDLNEFEESPQTVLKITESTENLLEHKDIEIGVECRESIKLPADNNNDEHNIAENTGETDEHLSAAEKAQRDAQIILDLLKNTKEFERIYKKPQKKRSTETGALTPTSPEMQEPLLIADIPPRPPSRSPPPLESDSDAAFEQKLHDHEAADEPIYETLLRNVHVPYKFSPILGRTKSAPYFKAREKKSPPMPRPESDYVTLVYSAEGTLQKVGEDMVERRLEQAQLRQQNFEQQQQQRDSASSSNSSSSSSSTLKRDSQNTVINVECLSSSNISQISATTTEAIYARAMPKNLMKRLLSTSSSNSNKNSHEHTVHSASEISLLPRALKSIDNLSLSFGRSNKPPERRVSDVSEMCRQSILHRQGSEAVGERMAHVDYADPKTLFTHVMTTSEASLQRDSVFSLTSSNDSMCEHKRLTDASMELPTNFEYEDDVEACLENDFRDSAIYSDDNEKRVDYEVVDCIKRPTCPPPPPPIAVQQHMRCPQLPPKPLSMQQVTNTDEVNTVAVTTAAGSVIICPPHLNAAASRSWVLQQIDNFSK